MGEFVAILTSVVTVAGLIAALVGHMQQVYRAARKDTILIGVPPKTGVPNDMSGIPCYSSATAAVRAHVPKAVVFCRSLSRALRTCDFVVYEVGSDPKMIVLGTDHGLGKIRAIL